MHTIKSHDILCEVDDEKGILKNIISESELNNSNDGTVPHHLLKLKVNDVCIILRNMPSLDLATNTKSVMILEANANIIKAQSIEANPRIVFIPKIRFKSKMHYGPGYEIMRTQFPLRLAYAITFNKAQSQTLDYVLLLQMDNICT